MQLATKDLAGMAAFDDDKLERSLNALNLGGLMSSAKYQQVKNYENEHPSDIPLVPYKTFMTKVIQKHMASLCVKPLSKINRCGRYLEKTASVHGRCVSNTWRP